MNEVFQRRCLINLGFPKIDNPCVKQKQKLFNGPFVYNLGYVYSFGEKDI